MQEFVQFFPKKKVNRFYFVLHSHWFKDTIMQLIYRNIFSSFVSRSLANKSVVLHLVFSAVREFQKDIQK